MNAGHVSLQLSVEVAGELRQGRQAIVDVSVRSLDHFLSTALGVRPQQLLRLGHQRAQCPKRPAQSVQSRCILDVALGAQFREPGVHFLQPHGDLFCQRFHFLVVRRKHLLGQLAMQIEGDHLQTAEGLAVLLRDHQPFDVLGGQDLGDVLVQLPQPRFGRFVDFPDLIGQAFPWSAAAL